MSIKLGDKVKDKISGFTGIVSCTCQYLYGCERAGVQPIKLDKEGKIQEAIYFDFPQLDVIHSGVIKPGVPGPGGPHPAPLRNKDPR